jgi:hypothetical protein
MKQEAAQVMADMNSGGGKTSASGTAGIKNLLDMNNTLMTGNVMTAGRLVVPVTFKNGVTMVDQTLNAKQANTVQQMNALIEFGTLQIQLKLKSTQ